MAENFRNPKVILEELFKGKKEKNGKWEKGALEKYSNVRHIQYEMKLHLNYGLPLGEVSRKTKAKFSRVFLSGQSISSVDRSVLDQAMKRLDYAVNVGCKGRCTRLVKELNDSMNALGIPTIEEIDKFLDWLTFYYYVRKDYEGNPLIEKPYGFEVRCFDDEGNRREFWEETQLFLKYDKLAPLRTIAKFVFMRRACAFRLRD